MHDPPCARPICLFVCFFISVLFVRKPKLTWLLDRIVSYISSMQEMNRMVYALFTPWLLPKIKHAFPMSFPSFVSSSIVGRPSHRMLKHWFLLSGRGEMAIRRRLDRDSWQGCLLTSYEVPCSSSSNSASSPLLFVVFPTLQSVTGWGLDGCGWGEVQSWGLTIHQPWSLNSCQRPKSSNLVLGAWRCSSEWSSGWKKILLECCVGFGCFFIYVISKLEVLF